MATPPSAPTESERVYHLELRHFPRNVCRFNLSGAELRATVLEPWAAERMFELGELRWDPRQARLTVLEGSRIPPAELSMGRGWRTAQRRSRDVTAQLLAEAAEALARRAGEAQRAWAPPGGVRAEAPAAGASEASAPAAARSPAGAGSGAADRLDDGTRAADLMADSLGLELLSKLGAHPAPLCRAWDLAAARNPGGPASEALAIAERAVASLLRAGLLVLLRADAPGAGADAAEAATAAGAALRPVGEPDAGRVLRAVESWTGDEQTARVWLRRA